MSLPATASPREPTAARRPLPRVLAVANQKGGVGKTTTAVNLGAALAELGYRTLVVDLDPQGNATTGLGINARNFDGSMYDVILHDVPDRGLHRAAAPSATSSWRPATIDLAGAEIELVPAFSRELRLQAGARRRARRLRLRPHRLPAVARPADRQRPGRGAARSLVPIQCEYYALEGLGQLLRNVDLVQSNLNRELECQHHRARHVRRPDQAGRPGRAAEVRSHFGDTGLPQRRAPDGPAVGGAVVRAADHRVRSDAPGAPSPTGSWPRR